MNDTRINILNKAVARFEDETGLRFTAYITDEKAELLLRDNEYDLKFTALIFPVINKIKLALIQNQFFGLDNIPLLITYYANNELIELLKNLNINFIDTAGNAFVKVPPLYVNVKGQKLLAAKKTDANETFIFHQAGMQIILALLCNPGLEKNPFREIAVMANVAVGTVHGTMRQLEKYDFLVIDKIYGKKLINKKKLLQEWTLGYPVKIKPKYFVGRYQNDNLDFIKNINLKQFGALFGGETAAAQITNYLRPFIHTIYIGEKLGEFILRNRLKKNANGNIEIIKKFWHFDTYTEINNIVHPILVYADLLLTGDQRNIETANLIYEKEIAGYIN